MLVTARRTAAVNLHGARIGIDDPILGHGELFVELALLDLVIASSRFRKHFVVEVWCALNPLPFENRSSVAADEHQVWIDDGAIREKHVDRRVVDLSETVRCHEQREDDFEIPGNVLVKKVRRSVHDVLTSNDLVAHAVGGHTIEILPGDSCLSSRGHDKSLRSL